MTQEFAGALRERIAIEQRVPGRDVWGGAAGGWTYDGAAWAAIAPSGTAADAAGGALAALPKWRVTIRKRGGIGLDTRIVWRGKFLKVRGVDSDPARPAELQLNCEEQR